MAKKPVEQVEVKNEVKERFFASNGVSCVSFYADKKQGAVIALYGDQTKQGAPPLAISVGLDGVPRLQVAANGEVKILDLRKLIDSLGAFIG